MRWAPLLLAGILLLPATGVHAASAGPGGPEPAGSDVLEDAADWLVDQRSAETGCIHGDDGPDHGSTAWATVAVAAAGDDPRQGQPSLVDGLAGECPPDPDATDPLTNSVNAIARHVIALVAAGEDPRSFDGEDWVEELRSYHANGEFVAENHPDAINDDAFAILALTAAGVAADDEMVQDAADTVLEAQNQDGGWGVSPSSDSMTDTTAAVVAGLGAADRLSPDGLAGQAARDYLAAQAGAEHGCFTDGQRSGANPFSTAWAVRSLPLIHADPRDQAWTSQGSAWDCVRRLQTEAGGFAVTDGGSASTWMTREAVPALAAIPHGRVQPDPAAPEASLAPASTPREGEQTTLEAEGASFAGWQLPDGTVLEGARASWTPEETGTVEMSVLVVDGHGQAATQAFETDVRSAPDNDGGGGSGTDTGRGGTGDTATDDGAPAPPEATVGAPATAERNVSLTVHVNATPGKAPVTAFRLATPETRTDWQPAGAIDVTLHQLGEVPVDAWARDAEGRVSEPARANVTVVDASPRITVAGPSVVDRQEPVTLTAEARDPDGATPNVTWTSGNRTATGPNATFAFDQPGRHEVQATARDAAGNQANATLALQARNRPPTNLTVTPRVLEANATEVLHADARDPEGDPLTVAWRPAGADEPTSWGGQLHLDTGAPGQRIVHVNVSDPHGGWTSARVELTVRDDPGTVDEPAELATRSSPVAEAGASPPGDPGPARVSLPDTLEAPANRSTLLKGTAASPTGHVRDVTVALGGPLEVRGKASFAALLPALPPGEYDVSARAQDADGWGPWTNATLVVHPEPTDEPVTPQSHTDPNQTPLGPAALLAVLAAAAGRRST